MQHAYDMTRRRQIRQLTVDVFVRAPHLPLESSRLLHACPVSGSERASAPAQEGREVQLCRALTHGDPALVLGNYALASYSTH